MFRRFRTVGVLPIVEPMIHGLSSVSDDDVVGCIFPISHGIMVVGITLPAIELSVLLALFEYLFVTMS